MPPLSLTVRCLALSLALAGFGLGALPAFAQSADVTAFNPYDGVGAPAPATVYAQPQDGPAGGPAFNPWNPAVTPAAQAPAVYASGSYAGPSYAGSSYAGSSYAPGANLPSPPPGPIESRLTAVPERPTGAAPSRTRAPAAAAAPMPSPPPAPEPVITRATPPAPVPIPVATAALPAPPSAPPPPAPPPRAIVAAPPRAVASEPPPPPAAAVPVAAATPAAPGPTLASISFAPQSAEISGAARADLDRATQSMKGLRQVELRAYAGGSDPTEARKVALARALSVRSYLIDQGVRGRIEVGAFASSNGGARGERVDVLGP